MRRLFKPLLILLALIFLVEAWLWEHLRPLVGWVVDLIAWKKLKARLADVGGAVLALFLFNLRTAFISALAIPLSLLSAVIVLLEVGVNLNVMVLGGLAIALGPYMARIPEGMLADSERTGIPIIGLPWEVNFRDVTYALLTRLMQRQYQFLTGVDRLHRDLLGLAARQGDLTALCAHVARLTSCSVAIADAAHQIIIAQRLATNPADYGALVPLVDQAKANLGRKLKEVSGDTGFATEANLQAMTERKIAAYLPPGRNKHGQDHVAGERRLKDKPLMAAMAKKLKRGGRRSRYRLRKQVVEPVFGQIKQARGFRQFLLRGLEKVRGEWSLICTAHNLTKLAGASA